MSLRKLESLRSTAAWRISIWPTVAFALVGAVAFVIVYLLVARGIHERSDAWLTGEVGVLADVSANTPRDSVYDRLMGEVAELASREVPDVTSKKTGSRENSVFFLLTRPSQEPVWVGPDRRDAFIQTLLHTDMSAGTPETVRFAGRHIPFQVVYHTTTDGGRLYLGFADIAAARFLRHLMEEFALIWFGTAMLGFCISSLGAYRTLSRVEHITDTVARIGSEDLASRLPEGPYEDEISRLSHTFNGMLNRIQAGAIVEADRSLLSRAIVNLLDNEVVHLPSRCQVWIRLCSGGDDAELVVEDDGPGFPPEVRARAFERFVKGGNSTGHGLGLAFVDAVVQAHGGSVRISDHHGRGTRIAVTLPLANVVLLDRVS